MTLQNIPSKSFKERGYQVSARHAMQDYFRKYLRQELETKPEGQIQTAMLAHMATGSGKTYTIGNFVNYLFDLRKTFMKVNKAKDVPRIHALVLNDRINLINQLKTDFLEGRSDKPSLVHKSFQDDITSRTFHSKSDDLEHEEDQLLAETGEIDIEVSGKGGDTFDFSTFQTAVNGLPIQDQPNLIIVDEAHHLAAPTYYEAFLQFYKPDAQGVYPLVLLMSATPDKILHLTGDPLVQFGLPEWIASEYSPKVNYNLVTNNQITPQDIERINSEIARISQIQDLKEKKRQIQILKEGEDGQGGINAMLRRYNSNDELVLDLLERVEKLDHTIIFCPNIEIVDQVTELINHYTGDENTAIPFHSKIDEADDSVLAKYNSGQSKVIVAVGKLNEGIDMPQTNNVVFWRETESPTIFQQQFGRGLRGDEVNIYDYVGGIRNLAWINSINESIDEIVSTEEEKTKEGIARDSDDTREKEVKHISIVMEGVGDIGQGVQHTVDLQDIVSKMQDLELTCDLTKEMVEEYFRQTDIKRWKNKEIKERAMIKIAGKGITTISSLYGIKGTPLKNKEDWYDLLEQIFGERLERREKTILTKEITEKYFKQVDVEIWKEKIVEYRKKIKIGEYGLMAISRLYDIKGNPITSQEIWYDLLEAIFCIKIPRLTKEIVEDYFKKADLEIWMQKKTIERKELKIGGNNLYKIGGLYKIDGDPTLSQNAWYDLLEQIFGKKIERKRMIYKKEELNKSTIETYFKKSSIEIWKEKKNSERATLYVGGNGLKNIARLYGIKGDSLNNKEYWYDLLEQIFGEKLERKKKLILTKEIVEEYFKKSSIEIWKDKKQSERATLYVGGNGLEAVATLYNIKKSLINNNESWYLFLENIFGKQIERIKKVEKKTITNEMVWEYFKDKKFEDMKELVNRKRKDLYIGGNGLISIARLYGIKGDPLKYKEVWYDLLEKIYGVKIERS